MYLQNENFTQRQRSIEKRSHLYTHINTLKKNFFRNRIKPKYHKTDTRCSIFKIKTYIIVGNYTLAHTCCCYKDPEVDERLRKDRHVFQQTDAASGSIDHATTCRAPHGGRWRHIPSWSWIPDLEFWFFKFESRLATHAVGIKRLIDQRDILDRIILSFVSR